MAIESEFGGRLVHRETRTRPVAVELANAAISSACFGEWNLVLRRN